MQRRMTYASARGTGLRERKRARTRATIVSAALELFARNGYQATTLAQIAEAAEIAPSTLHAYFPAKEDILFSGQDEARDSARTRILERPASETLAEALLAWITDIVPELFGADGEALVRQGEIIGTDETLIAARRLRHALLEDTFAEVFAADSDQSVDDLHPRLMASVVTNTFVTVWQWWYTHRTDEQPNRRKLYALDATYVTGLIAAADNALKMIPSP
jgi:AcrR family transcriptional regulator